MAMHPRSDSSTCPKTTGKRKVFVFPPVSRHSLTFTMSAHQQYIFARAGTEPLSVFGDDPFDAEISSSGGKEPVRLPKMRLELDKSNTIPPQTAPTQCVSIKTGRDECRYIACANPHCVSDKGDEVRHKNGATVGRSRIVSTLQKCGGCFGMSYCVREPIILSEKFTDLLVKERGMPDSALESRASRLLREVCAPV